MLNNNVYCSIGLNHIVCRFVTSYGNITRRRGSYKLIVFHIILLGIEALAQVTFIVIIKYDNAFSVINYALTKSRYPDSGDNSS